MLQGKITKEMSDFKIHDDVNVFIGMNGEKKVYLGAKVVALFQDGSLMVETCIIGRRNLHKIQKNDIPNIIENVQPK